MRGFGTSGYTQNVKVFSKIINPSKLEEEIEELVEQASRFVYKKHYSSSGYTPKIDLQTQTFEDKLIILVTATYWN